MKRNNFVKTANQLIKWSTDFNGTPIGRMELID